MHNASARPKRRVLVVDDDPRVRAVCAALLSEFGYGVIEACDGVHALSILETCSVDALLLDVEMPRLRGDELVDKLARERPELPLLVMSSSDQYRNLIERGARDFLAKPFRASQLHSGVSALFPETTLRRRAQ